jgi:hypothetical protein
MNPRHPENMNKAVSFQIRLLTDTTVTGGNVYVREKGKRPAVSILINPMISDGNKTFDTYDHGVFCSS